MSKFSLEQLTEGIRQRHLGSHNRQLVEKWSRTGLLRGLEGQNREVMSTLLENQAAQLLRERSTLGTGGGAMGDSGDMSGFQNVAFPIVRRVFGGLVANELVSIQPMSLPSGLLFYLDYTYGSNVGGDSADQAGNAATYVTGSSIYNSPSGKNVRTGSDAVGGNYDLAGSGYSRVHESVESAATGASVLAFGSWGSSATASLTEGAILGTSGSDGADGATGPQGPTGPSPTAGLNAMIPYEPYNQNNAAPEQKGYIKLPSADTTTYIQFTAPSTGYYTKARMLTNGISGIPGISAETIQVRMGVYDNSGTPIEGVYVDRNNDNIINDDDSN